MAQILVDEAPQWGIQLLRRGDTLVLRPAGRCPDELRELLRAHKTEILDLLEAQVVGLSPDRAPWLHVGKQILAGEFAGMDSSTRESLAIGLRNIAHPICKEALKRLDGEPKRFPQP